MLILKNLAHAEDAAVEDALYFLGESLRRGVLDCESFLKHVRNMSEPQMPNILTNNAD